MIEGNANKGEECSLRYCANLHAKKSYVLYNATHSQYLLHISFFPWNKYLRRNRTFTVASTNLSNLLLNVRYCWHQCHIR